MYRLEFDCQQLASADDFYLQLSRQYPDHPLFGHNLDALWDWLTGELPLPLELVFYSAQPEQFADGQPLAALMQTLLQAQQQMPREISILVKLHSAPDCCTDN